MCTMGAKFELYEGIEWRKNACGRDEIEIIYISQYVVI